MNNFEESIKEIIVEQRAKIKKLESKNNILEALLKEYRLALAKNEPPGLLTDAVGRKILFHIIKEDK